MQTKLLFLDIDGVLNDHRRHPGSPYCGLLPRCVGLLNAVLARTQPSIVLTSSWRYQHLLGDMTLLGMEQLLYTHGLVPPAERGRRWLCAVTEKDATRNANRADQVRRSLQWHESKRLKVVTWAVLDDLTLDFGADQWRFVQTDGTRGLIRPEAERLAAILRGPAVAA